MRDPKPRLLILITLSELGGAQTAVALLLPGLVGQFEVTLAAQGSGPLRDAAEAAGVRYVELDHVRRPIDPWHDALALVELIRLCRRVRPEIVHVHSSKMGVLGRLAAWLARVPVRILTVHGWSFAAYNGLTRSLFLWIERLMRPLTSTVVCVSEATRAEGLAAGVCDPQHTVVVHNAVDVRSFAPRSRRDGTPEVVGVGRFAYPKDFTTLLAALRLVEAPCHVRLAGDGPGLTEVASALTRNGLSATGRTARRPSRRPGPARALRRLRALEPLRGLPGVRPGGHGGRLAGGGDERRRCRRGGRRRRDRVARPGRGRRGARSRPRAARGGRRAAATPGSCRSGQSAQPLRRLGLSGRVPGALLAEPQRFSCTR